MLPRNASLGVVIFTAAVIGIGSAMLTPLISLRVEAAGIRRRGTVRWRRCPRSPC